MTEWSWRESWRERHKGQSVFTITAVELSVTLSLNNIAELRPPQYIVPLSHLPVMLSEVVIYHVNVCSSLDNEDMKRQITLISED